MEAPTQAGRCLGLYLSHGSAKAALLESDGRQMWVSAMREASLPLGAVDDSGLVRSPAAVAQGAIAALGGVDTAGTRLCIAVGGNNVILRTMTLPPMRDGELREAIRAEIAHYSLFSLGEEVVGYQTYSSAGDDVERRLLVAATHRRLLDSCEAAARGVGRLQEGLEPAILTAARAAFVAGDLHSELPSLTMLILLGTWGTEALIVSENEVLFAHSADLNVTGALAGDATSAQDTLLDRFDEAVESGELSLRAEAIRSLCVEASHCLRFFQREFPTAPPVVRVGVFSDVPVSEDVEHGLGEHLRLPVLELDPCRHIPVTDPAWQDDNLREKRAVYAPAIGAALRGLGIGAESFAVPLTAAKRPSPEKARQRGLLLALVPAAVLLAACLMLSGNLRGHVRDNQAQIRRMRQEISDITHSALEDGQPIKDKKDALAALKAAEGRISAPGTARSDALREIVRCLPPKATLARAAIDDRGRLTLEGFAPEEAAASQLVVSLTASDTFEGVRLISLQRTAGQDVPGVMFRITGELMRG